MRRNELFVWHRICYPMKNGLETNMISFPEETARLSYQYSPSSVSLGKKQTQNNNGLYQPTSHDNNAYIQGRGIWRTFTYFIIRKSMKIFPFWKKKKWKEGKERQVVSIGKRSIPLEWESIRPRFSTSASSGWTVGWMDRWTDGLTLGSTGEKG